jgi:hypothetical protein
MALFKFARPLLLRDEAPLCTVMQETCLFNKEFEQLVWCPRNNWTIHFFAFLRRGSVQPG